MYGKIYYATPKTNGFTAKHYVESRSKYLAWAIGGKLQNSAKKHLSKPLSQY